MSLIVARKQEGPFERLLEALLVIKYLNLAGGI